MCGRACAAWGSMFTPDALMVWGDAGLAQRVHDLKAMAADLGTALAVHADAAGKVADCRSEDARVCALAASVMSEYATVVEIAANAMAKRASMSASVSSRMSELISEATTAAASNALVLAMETELYAAVDAVVTTRIETTPAMTTMRDTAVRANVGHERVKASMGERSSETDTWGMAVVAAVWALMSDQRGQRYMS